jgi:hypothetical protein
MGRIKSALEIALERTKSVESDKNSVNQYNLKQQGKKAANQFLENPENSLVKEIEKCSKEDQSALKQGMFDLLLSQITLPSAKEALGRIEHAAKGLDEIIQKAEFSLLCGQLLEALNQYIAEAEQFEQLITQQYAPKLRQKEEELARRTGRQVTLDPFQDPEFVAFYNQNMTMLKDRYQAAIDQVRETASELFNEEPRG